MGYDLSNDKGYLKLVEEAKKEHDESKAVDKLSKALKAKVEGTNGTFKKSAIAGIEQITEKVLNDTKLQKGKKIGYFTELASNLPALELALNKSKEPWATDLKGLGVSDSSEKENIKELEEKVKKLKNKVDLEGRNPSFIKVMDAILDINNKATNTRSNSCQISQLKSAQDSCTEVSSAYFMIERTPNIIRATSCAQRNELPAKIVEECGDVLIAAYKEMLERMKKAKNMDKKAVLLDATGSKQSNSGGIVARMSRMVAEHNLTKTNAKNTIEWEKCIDLTLTGIDSVIKAIENLLKLIPIAIKDYDDKYYPAFRDWKRYSSLLVNEKSSRKVKFTRETFLNAEIPNPRLGTQRKMISLREKN